MWAPFKKTTTTTTNNKQKTTTKPHQNCQQNTHTQTPRSRMPWTWGASSSTRLCCILRHHCRLGSDHTTRPLRHSCPHPCNANAAGWNSLGSGPRLLRFSWTYRTFCSYRNINSLIMENKDFWYFPPSMPLVHIKSANPWPVLLDACFWKKCYLRCWLQLRKTRSINLGLGLGQKSQQSQRWPYTYFCQFVPCGYVK